MTTGVVFNPFVPSFKKNPYLQYARLRDAEPVHRSQALQAWVLTGYEDCLAVLRDHETFSSDSRSAGGAIAEAIRQQREASVLRQADTILGLDPPRHTTLRALVSRAFTPRRVQELRPHIEEIAASLLDEADRAGDEWDLMETLAQPLPVIVIAELLGHQPGRPPPVQGLVERPRGDDEPAAERGDGRSRTAGHARADRLLRSRDR
jgi:pimeloyl-[acyl-carrier protein] synthase